MLDNMTPEWAAIANSIAVYVQLKKESLRSFYPDSFIDEYNAWLHWSGMTVNDNELAEWCTSFLKAQYDAPESLIREALSYDGIPIKSMKPVI